MNANTLLKKQHREVEQAYEKFQKADGEKKEELGKEILLNLTVHAEVEEELYYPLLDEAGKTDEVAEYRAEHEAAKTLIAKLTKMDTDDEEFDGSMKALMEEVLHHIKEEESEAMPEMADAIGEEKLEELGPKMEKRTEELKDSTLKRLWAKIT